ncbi:MAG: GntR family transcriptional regulator [Pseudomonadota bacterium]|nr:GntR family transcriptional regulator [Pseudomonadota bacterium]
MSIGLEDATDALRTAVLDGAFTPGSKLREVSVSENLGVSRTLARLAMSALEHEGLLERIPNRGSRVRSFSISQIADAIEVRGELEGMAVRRAAERGLSDNACKPLRDLIAQSEELLTAGVDTEERRQAWVDINVAFHNGLIEASGNWALSIAIKQISALPLVSSTAIIFDRKNFDRSQRQLRAAHDDHIRILNAVCDGRGHRAEALMREHAFMNAQNKRTNLSDRATLDLVRDLPGGKLVSAATSQKGGAD